MKNIKQFDSFYSNNKMNEAVVVQPLNTVDKKYFGSYDVNGGGKKVGTLVIEAGKKGSQVKLIMLDGKNYVLEMGFQQ